MDDMYQYASAAVNSNTPNNTNQQQGTEDNDIVLQAFNNFGWGQRFNSLLDTVKKQSEALVETTRRDFEEIAQVLREDGNNEDTSNRDMSTSTSSTTTAGTSSTTTEVPSNNNDTMSFAALRERISALDLNSLLPTQRLPENMDLTQLRSEVIQGTRHAEQYLQKFGSEVMDVVTKAITVLEPEEDTTNGQSSSEGSNPRIYATRKEALLAKMRVDPETYMQEPEDSKVHETFNAGFNIQEYTDEIASLLKQHTDLENIMHELVPVKVDYTTFWKRYFYRAWCIEQDEQKRQMIVKGAHEHDDEADFKWDSDEEDEEDHSKIPTKDDQQQEHDKSKSKQSTDSKGGSDTDFSNISEPVSTEPSLVSPPLKSQTDGDDWVKADPKKKTDNDDDDSDSDWE
ncbi:BSD-domain-containing protein [Lichtheimia hyalospora FSU 10163]|nr:BSD-domain-containing protein [Lichtheimia hyalospora FSU 10163]